MLRVDRTICANTFYVYSQCLLYRSNSVKSVFWSWSLCVFPKVTCIIQYFLSPLIDKQSYYIKGRITLTFSLLFNPTGTSITTRLTHWIVKLSNITTMDRTEMDLISYNVIGIFFSLEGVNSAGNTGRQNDSGHFSLHSILQAGVHIFIAIFSSFHTAGCRE